MRLLHPVPGARVSQRFGANPAVYAVFGLAGHNGLDFSCVVGTPVRAAHDGTVFGHYAASSYGVYLEVIDTTRRTIYAHLVSTGVADGKAVKAGDIVGHSGNTGNSTGPHLHFGLYDIPRSYNNGYKGAIDPEPYLVEEGSMGSKLSFHTQQPSYPEWLKRHVREAGVQWVKIMDPDAGLADPFGVRTIGRLFFAKDVDKALIVEGAAGADKYYAMAKPRHARAAWVYAWEGPNEPDVTTPMACRNLAAFSRRLGYLMHQDGRRYVALSLSTGNPPDDAYWLYLGVGLQHADYLGLHEYGMRVMTLDGWHLLRYRKAVAALKRYGFNVPPIFITETGIDFSGDPIEDGWRKWASEQSFMAQLAAYDAELQKDPYVLGACPFTWMPYGWPSFEMIESMSYRMSQYVKAQGAFNPWGAATVPTPQPEVLVNREDGARAVAWNALGVPYNPGAAFVKYAKANGMGRPLGPERTEGRYTVQPFDRGIVYAVDANWGTVTHLTW